MEHEEASMIFEELPLLFSSLQSSEPDPSLDMEKTQPTSSAVCTAGGNT